MSFHEDIVESCDQRPSSPSNITQEQNAEDLVLNKLSNLADKQGNSKAIFIENMLRDEYSDDHQFFEPESPIFDGAILINPRSPIYTPPFKRVDFDEIPEDGVEDRKPAWKQLEESIKDSYYNARKTAERTTQRIAFIDSQIQRKTQRRSESPFAELSSRTPLMHRLSLYDVADESVIYAAPAVHKSQGIESSYEKKAADIESRLLKTSPLPESMKTITPKEFRRAPSVSVGGVTEALLEESEYQAYLPRPYYSRPSRDDPDYFDFDLNHSVDLYRRPEGKYVPLGPQEWEKKILNEMKCKGDAPVSGYMFTKGDMDWRNHGTSYLSAALRTASFWEQRFTAIGREVRDRNPVSLESIARNKPIPSRWTEYHDPELEDLSDIDD